MHRIRKLRAFGRNQQGATAIEFAIVSFAFMLLFMGIIEFGLFMMTEVTIESAVAQAGRQAAVASGTGACDRVCTVVGAIQSKTASLIRGGSVSISTSVITTGGAGTTKPDICMDNPDQPSTSATTCKSWIESNGIAGYQGDSGVKTAGKDGDLVEVRASYAWKVLFPILGQVFTAKDGSGNTVYGTVMITSSTVVKNE